MSHQGYDDNPVYADSLALVWTVWKVHIILLHTVAALSSDRVPDLVLSYVFTHHAEATLSSLHIKPACIIAAPMRSPRAW